MCRQLCRGDITPEQAPEIFLRPDLTVEWDNYAKASVRIATGVVVSGDLVADGNPIEEITGPAPHGAQRLQAPAASERGP